MTPPNSSPSRTTATATTTNTATTATTASTSTPPSSGSSTTSSSLAATVPSSSAHPTASSSSSQIPRASIAGVVIGSLIGSALLAMAAILLFRRRRRRPRRTRSRLPQPPGPQIEAGTLEREPSLHDPRYQKNLGYYLFDHTKLEAADVQLPVSDDEDMDTSQSGSSDGHQRPPAANSPTSSTVHLPTAKNEADPA